MSFKHTIRLLVFFVIGLSVAMSIYAEFSADEVQAAVSQVKQLDKARAELVKDVLKAEQGAGQFPFDMDKVLAMKEEELQARKKKVEDLQEKMGELPAGDVAGDSASAYGAVSRAPAAREYVASLILLKERLDVIAALFVSAIQIKEEEEALARQEASLSEVEKAHGDVWQEEEDVELE